MTKYILLILIISLNSIKSQDITSLTTSLNILNTPVTPKINLIIKVGELLNMKVDAIVNAANPPLLGGGGIDGAIHKAAGANLLEYIKSNIEINTKGERCPIGQARIAPSFNLKPNIQYIIFTVGPDCRNENQNKKMQTLLTDAYKNSLIIANQYKLTSIAFPSISTAIYKCSLQESTETAIKTIFEYVQANPNTTLKNIYLMIYYIPSNDKAKIQKNINIFEAAIDKIEKLYPNLINIKKDTKLT